MTDLMLDALYNEASKNANSGDFRLLLELIEYGLNNQSGEFNTVLDLVGNKLIDISQARE